MMMNISMVSGISSWRECHLGNNLGLLLKLGFLLVINTLTIVTFISVHSIIIYVVFLAHV